MSLENDKFFQISNSILNPYIEEWKKDNKKVMGYYCTYLPEELIHAAGFLPFRIRATGSQDTDLGDVYMVRFTCSFVRMTLNVALNGGFDFLDGLIMSNCCDHARRMHEVFDLKVFSRKEFKQKPSQFYTVIPHVITEAGFDYFKNKILKLKEEIEKKYNLEPISDEKLNLAIEIYNENRKLLREIYELRTIDSPKLTGSEALQISMANSSIPKEIANNELKRVLNILREREGLKSNKKRIMLIGSVLDNTYFTKTIENAGGEIVADFICFGTRNIFDDIELKGGSNPMEEITKRVYYRISCPRMMDDHPRRLKFIEERIKEAKVDGVIVQRINNCDLHGCENMNLQYDLKELDIPVFNIDRENFQKDTSRMQNRIEAFIEMMK
ncbi:MAG: 2-hydroxyacyl-CoA dehydratase subunit D [Promethearchaeota archaeon]